MKNLRWTSIKVVLDKVLRDPIFIGLTYESIVDYLVDFMAIVGTPELFEEKIVTELPITAYRALLPVDFVEEVQVSIDRKIARQSPDTHAGYYNDINTVTDQAMIKQVIESTYRLKGDYIYLSQETGTLMMVYKAIKVQDDVDAEDYGYPMLPDDSVFILAFQAYVEVQFLKMLFRAGKVSNQVLEEAKQTYCWKVGQYETHSKRLTLGEMETISKMFRSLQPKNNEFSTRFKNLGVR